MTLVRQFASRSTRASGSRPSNVSPHHAKQKGNLVESNLIFVLGEAGSGKSSFALQKGKTQSPRAFLATAEPFDSEMAIRIQKHKKYPVDESQKILWLDFRSKAFWARDCQTFFGVTRPVLRFAVRLRWENHHLVGLSKKALQDFSEKGVLVR